MSAITETKTGIATNVNTNTGTCTFTPNDGTAAIVDLALPKQLAFGTIQVIPIENTEISVNYFGVGVQQIAGITQRKLLINTIEIDEVSERKEVRANENLTMNIDQLSINAQDTNFNNGAKGGLINIQDLTNRLNLTVHALNSLITLYNAHVHTRPNPNPNANPPGLVTSLPAFTTQLFNRADYEDTNVEH